MKESLEIRDEGVAGKRAAYHPVIKKRSAFHRTVETEVDFTENTHSKGWSWNGFAPVAFLFFFWWASLAFTGGATPVAHADFDEIKSDLSSSSEEVASEEKIDQDNGDDVDDPAEEDEGSCEESECNNSSSSVITTLKDRGSEDLEEDENNGMEEEINEMLDGDRCDSSCDDSSTITINELKNRLEDDFDGDHGIDEMDKKIEEMLSGSSSDPICCDSDIMNEIRDRLEDEFDDYENLCDPCDDVDITANISADPEEVYEGGSTTLEWSSDNATYCEGDNFDVASSTNGSTTVDNIQDDTTFTLNCYDDEDNQADDSVTVTVKEQKKDDTGSIRICKMIVDENGDIVTDSDGLPDGEFEISLYNSYEQGDEIASFALESDDFTPNTSIIGNENDAHCETFDELELHSGSIDHKNDGFFYTEEAVEGELWESVGYNDQFNTDVESTEDFYSYDDLFVEGELNQDRNKNSDGHIILSENNSDRTLVVLNKHEERDLDPITPEVTLEAEPTTVEKGATTTLTWDSEDAETCYSDDFETNDATSGSVDVAVDKETDFTVTCESETGDTESDSVTVNVEKTDDPYASISADPKTVNKGGSTDLEWSSENVDSCEGVNFDNQGDLNGTIKISDLQKTKTFTINCSYGDGETVSDSVTVTVKEDDPEPKKRGGGGALVIASSDSSDLEITNEQIEDLGSNEETAIISWDTNMPATSQIVYGTESIDEEDLNMRSDTFGYQDQTIEMDRDLDDHYMAVTDLEPDTEYYFRPVSQAKGQEAIGVELSMTTPPEAERSPVKDIECSYLEDYLRRDFDNDPIEVYKLQVFLNEYENIDTPVSGVFDQATYESVVEFQERYADQVLHPWGHTEGTGYVYITTKKLINETVCEDDITLGEEDLAEIESYRAFMSNLEREGLTPPFTQEEVDQLRDELGDDVDSFIEEDEDTEEEESEHYDLKEMEIGLEDDEDEDEEKDKEKDEEKDEEKGFMAGASSALTDFPSTLHEATENLMILILMILLIYLLTILLIPVSSEAPSAEDERRTSFKRIVLFSSLVLVAFLGVLAISAKGLATPLGVVLAISVLVLIMKLKDKKRPINQELDLGES